MELHGDGADILMSHTYVQIQGIEDPVQGKIHLVLVIKVQSKPMI